MRRVLWCSWLQSPSASRVGKTLTLTWRGGCGAEELDAVERALDVRSAHDSKLQRRLRAERLRLQVRV